MLSKTNATGVATCNGLSAASSYNSCRRDQETDSGAVFRCATCGKQYKHHRNLKAHELAIHSNVACPSGKCGYHLNRQKKLNRHFIHRGNESTPKAPRVGVAMGHVTSGSSLLKSKQTRPLLSEQPVPKRQRLFAEDEYWSGDEETNEELGRYMDSIDWRDSFDENWSGSEDTDIELSRFMESIEDGLHTQIGNEDADALPRRYMESVEDVDPNSWSDDDEELANFAMRCEANFAKKRNEKRQKLPAYIRNSKALYSLARDPRGGFSDHLSLFRCLALHFVIQKTKRPSRSIERLTKSLFNRYAWNAGISPNFRTFQGVSLSELSLVEEIFLVNIRVFSMHPSDSNQSRMSIHLLRESPYHYPDDETMILNVFNGHFSYVSNWILYFKDYRCWKCNSCFTKSSNCRRHVASCRINLDYL